MEVSPRFLLFNSCSMIICCIVVTVMDLEIKFYIKINLQVRDAVDVTSRAGDVVLQRTLVRRERETVMDLVTEDNMMDMQGVRET